MITVETHPRAAALLFDPGIKLNTMLPMSHDVILRQWTSAFLNETMKAHESFVDYCAFVLVDRASAATTNFVLQTQFVEKALLVHQSWSMWSCYLDCSDSFASCGSFCQVFTINRTKKRNLKKKNSGTFRTWTGWSPQASGREHPACTLSRSEFWFVSRLLRSLARSAHSAASRHR